MYTKQQNQLLPYNKTIVLQIKALLNRKTKADALRATRVLTPQEQSAYDRIVSQLEEFRRTMIDDWQQVIMEIAGWRWTTPAIEAATSSERLQALLRGLCDTYSRFDVADYSQLLVDYKMAHMAIYETYTQSGAQQSFLDRGLTPISDPDDPFTKEAI
jgi:hypothetical protein